MENKFDVGYCLVHERLFPIFMLEAGTKCSDPDYIHPEVEEVSNRENCHGPFVFSEPPSPLTDEDWEQIFEMKEMV